MDGYDPRAARMAPAPSVPAPRQYQMDDPMTSGMQSLLGPAPGMEAYGLEEMTEEDLAKLVELGVIDENMAENARQMQLAEKLRYGTASPEGRQAGRVYVAANPLEHLGRGLEQWNAQKKMGELEKQRGEMGQQQTEGRQTYWDILRGMRRKPQDFSGVQAPNIEL